MFGSNLRALAKQYSSISDLARKLDINRTQFNRYLSGESFPRPDVLDRICRFFDVDARILLEPVERLTENTQLLGSPFLAEFMGKSSVLIPESQFPSGFYRFSRRSFTDQSLFVVGVMYALREGGLTVVRGFEAKEAMRAQGLPVDARTREFRGYISQQEDGLAMMLSRRNSLTGSYNYMSRVSSFENNFWVGYTTRSMRESLTATRITRMVFEHLGRDTGTILAAARGTGFRSADELLPFHRRLLQIDAAFR
ncbi:helix-turn-helix domain-containing protein [Pseudodonghicola flavimaris]|uniref:Helix-turn-helix transcriptional regulator n=1 Tax=Pseudodonghicola flavimaris TaxID=3050036 RepID=A0ABT7EVG9_9RHOB|nr:helix-turn-helix transcriptional regulator [Pseudodonghicola flavimaris]MDK3016308.1 helix-turn-helix transcriptional regulator [Pseudodonghicola flavimaris]